MITENGLLFPRLEIASKIAASHNVFTSIWNWWLVTIATMSQAEKHSSKWKIYFITWPFHAMPYHQCFWLAIWFALMLPSPMLFSRSLARSILHCPELPCKSYFRTLLVNNNMYKFMIKPCERDVAMRKCVCVAVCIDLCVSCMHMWLFVFCRFPL